MAKSSRKSSKKLSLKKKALEDLPLKGKGKSTKGGGSLTLGKLGDLNLAPPYTPVMPAGGLLRPELRKPGL